MRVATLCVFVTVLVAAEGTPPSNYDLSRSRIGGGFGIRDLLSYVLGNGYGDYPGHYGPGHYGPPGPPGAHPGCPLCDSSVYSYCSHKQIHDSCCCHGAASYIPFACRQTDCNFLYANSCEEHNLISDCCCVDLQKSAVPEAPHVPVIVG